MVKYGFDVEYEAREESGSAFIHIVKHREVYEDNTVLLTPSYINELSQFVLIAHIQYTVDNLLPLMSQVGWKLEIDQRPARPTYRHLTVTRPGGKTTTYAPTYADMLQLRQDLDVDAVSSLVALRMPELLKAGYRRTLDTARYTFIAPSGDTISFALNDKEQAEFQTARMLDPQGYLRKKCEANPDKPC